MIQVLEWSKEKPYMISGGKFQCIQIPFIDPLLNKQKYSYKKFLENLMHLDADINRDFKENSPYQEGVILETYQRPDRSYFQEPPELDRLINTGKLVQKFLPKQANI